MTRTTKVGRRRRKKRARLCDLPADLVVGRRRKRTSLCDLPSDLVAKAILPRVPITSLGAVRSTCKLWDTLTREWILGTAAAAKQQSLGFMTKNSKVCSIGFHLDKEGEDLLDLSVKEVDLLNQVEISRVFHCDGLLLCVLKDNSRLMVWNPYLGQTKWIGPRTEFHRLDSYALGYNINGNHKILRLLYYYKGGNKMYEIYEFSSNSWRVIKVPLDSEIMSHQGGVSLKGSTYFCAHFYETNEDETMEEKGCFLLCFDFTTERFGRPLPLPIRSNNGDTLALSWVREEKLAVLHQLEGINDRTCNIVQIWVTTTIESNYVSWSKFLRVEMKPFALTGIWFNSDKAGSFFVNEEDKVVVVFDIDGYELRETARYHTAFVIGEEGYFKTVSLGVAPKVAEPCPISGYIPEIYCPPLVCSSSYHPSLAQLN